uniref:DUF21 domain-containing protein, chloroplastic n=1 Tax=Vitis vinifera TaxID=29760 RepID=A5BGG1_VITVI|nr:hypothetical protein VITISV_018001 [Vitis vinifera]
MEAALQASILGRPKLLTASKPSFFVVSNRRMNTPIKFSSLNFRYPSGISVNCVFSNSLSSSPKLTGPSGRRSGLKGGENPSSASGNLDFFGVLLRRGVVLGAMVCGVLVLGCSRVFAVEGVVDADYGVLRRTMVVLRGAWPKTLQLLRVFKDQGLILAALLGLSAFFSMAETSITTLWPWKVTDGHVLFDIWTGAEENCWWFDVEAMVVAKLANFIDYMVRELAEKESENGVFKMLRSDVTRFLTTILIGTTFDLILFLIIDIVYVLSVVNIGATALVTEAATQIFGEAGITAATAVMTVAILLLTEITPKSLAVHNATEVARFVVRPVAWLSFILYPVGRVVTYLSMGMLKMLGLKGRSEPYVTEEELKLMLRGAELSGAIEEEEQDMIENVLEIKDTHVREVMTPLVDVVAIDASATLVDFHELWLTHQYSRVPVFEQRVDNIVGVAYAMDLLDYLQKGEILESSIVGDMAHKPAYFVPDSMSVWNLLREFRIRKVHMAVVLNEYGGTVGIVTLEDVVEEIVGEIFDENDSKEEIQKKTGYVVMKGEGIFDVDANTSIDQLSEDLNIKMPEGHQYETVSGFICEVFGYIPRTGESIKVVLENQEENEEYTEQESDRQEQKEKQHIFKLEILAGNARKVSAVRFERINNDDAALETKEVTRLVPKIMKRKWSDGEDSDSADDKDSDSADNDEDAHQMRPEDGLSDGYVIAEHKDDHDSHNEQ